MLALQKGIYLGDTGKHMQNEDVGICITSYTDSCLFDKRHCHENPHISFVLQGGSLEKRKNKEIERLPGKITFYHSGEYHQSTHLDSSSRHINLEFYNRLLSENSITENGIADAVCRNPDTKFFLLKMYKELLANDELSGLSIKMMLLEIIANNQQFNKRCKNRLWLQKMDEILRDNLGGTISLDQLSVALNLHPVTISKQFHESYSCTLGEYVRKLRIEKALTLIKNANYSLTEIAYICGFADQSHFVRVFKTFTGLLPKAFQKL